MRQQIGRILDREGSKLAQPPEHLRAQVRRRWRYLQEVFSPKVVSDDRRRRPRSGNALRPVQKGAAPGKKHSRHRRRSIREACLERLGHWRYTLKKEMNHDG